MVMKRTKAIASLAGLVFLGLILSTTTLAQQPPDNVAGNWTIYATNIENGETVVKHVQITQYGNKLAGYFEGPNQSGPIEGEINGHHIRFSTVTRNVLNFWGQVYGDNMSGTFGLHGKHAAWQAVRPAPVADSSSPPSGTVYASQPVLTPPAPAAAPAPAVNQATAQPATAPVAQPASYSTTQVSSPAPAPASLSADQLDALVAPIALYPDALVAQVLAASTNPDQVAYADDWLAQNKSLTGTALTQAVDQQSWDPSVKALTQFPSVLDNLAHNLSWTSSLGQAFASQQADVMAAVQTMRAKAQVAGTLQSTTQITVTQPSPNTIVIQPANPQVVYVPQYNPAVIYGAPIAVPLYVPPPVPVAAVGVYFGSGITVGAAFGGGSGWHAWNVNWGGGGGSTIIYNNNTYINNHIWNNTNYNGYRPWANGAAGTQNHAYYAANGTYHPDANYRPGTDTHYGPDGKYRPNGYYGPDGGWHQDGSVNHAGGATGSENHGYYAANGSYHPDPGYQPGTDTHYGPNGAYHPNGYYGPDGGWHNDASGTKPADQPNGGQNGNHGLIGGNGGVQRTAQTDDARQGNNAGRLMGANRTDNNSRAAGQNRSPMSGNGRSARAESTRGHASMHPSGTQRAAMRRPATHSQPAHNGGGEHRR
jgi:Protein of unknown function (DUF3300)